jgi:hypothetical protein
LRNVEEAVGIGSIMSILVDAATTFQCSFSVDFCSDILCGTLKGKRRWYNTKWVVRTGSGSGGVMKGKSAQTKMR